jgi:hypothetical protein
MINGMGVWRNLRCKRFCYPRRLWVRKDAFTPSAEPAYRRSSLEAVQIHGFGPRRERNLRVAAALLASVRDSRRGTIV